MLDEQQRQKVAEDFTVLGPILMTIPASKLAVIVMHELMSSILAHGGVTAYSSASRRIGRAVQVSLSVSH